MSRDRYLERNTVKILVFVVNVSKWATFGCIDELVISSVRTYNLILTIKRRQKMYAMLLEYLDRGDSYPAYAA